MNRPSSENNQACLNCRVAREKESKTQSTGMSKMFVVDRGIEPLCQDWESCILTIRWIDQHFKKRFSEIPLVRKEGDSNPRYGNPYGSLANCWFQPLTHPSKKDPRAVNLGASPRLRVQRYYLFLNPPNFYATFFRKSYLNAITSLSSESR